MHLLQTHAIIITTRLEKKWENRKTKIKNGSIVIVLKTRIE